MRDTKSRIVLIKRRTDWYYRPRPETFLACDTLYRYVYIVRYTS